MSLEDAMREGIQRGLDRGLQPLLDTLEKRTDALFRICDWADAYPLDAFPDQDLKRADEVLRAAGISMSAMHGQWARHIVRGIGDIARSGLNAPFRTPTDRSPT